MFMLLTACTEATQESIYDLSNIIEYRLADIIDCELNYGYNS